jgi:RimJ/RimL family protein N-acetyltransferase
VELLRTPRLALRSWTDEDAPAFLDLYGREEVVRWLGTQPRSVTVTTLELARERIRHREERIAGLSPPMGIWGIVPVESGRDEPIGTVLLMPLEEEGAPTNLVEVGWHLHPDWQGRGYATEASAAALERAGAAGIEVVIALIDLDNERSQRLAVRLGMTDEGLTDRWYGLTLREYRKVLGAAGA